MPRRSSADMSPVAEVASETAVAPSTIVASDPAVFAFRRSGSGLLGNDWFSTGLCSRPPALPLPGTAGLLPAGLLQSLHHVVVGLLLPEHVPASRLATVPPGRPILVDLLVRVGERLLRQRCTSQKSQQTHQTSFFPESLARRPPVARRAEPRRLDHTLPVANFSSWSFRLCKYQSQSASKRAKHADPRSTTARQVL